MPSRVRIVAALAFALALGAAAAGALPPTAHRSQRTARPITGVLATARGWNGQISTVRGADGTHMDPDGLLYQILKPILGPLVPGGSPPSS